ncbi:FitA-like ribbon-helix-helix domain-containing protein [Nonomuraea glycinis]|jgi:plasmid stability protein|uniref:FitA-like ribbon-helix-helix domain-containing protein n=1 Tax=Nonomuraea glycinis TaxID=2047744 RepID=UPI0033A65485
MGTIQIRDVPDATERTLKARAEREGKSLTAFVRDLLNEEAGTPTLDEVMARIAADEPVAYDPDFVRETMREGGR